MGLQIIPPCSQQQFRFAEIWLSRPPLLHYLKFIGCRHSPAIQIRTVQTAPLSPSLAAQSDGQAGRNGRRPERILPASQPALSTRGPRERRSVTQPCTTNCRDLCAGIARSARVHLPAHALLRNDIELQTQVSFSGAPSTDSIRPEPLLPRRPRPLSGRQAIDL
jgi:hypothetical protein